MTTTTFHLAQFNYARAKEPLESDLLAPFVAALDRINALAEASPGFVWRLEEALSADLFDDPKVIVNLSVWEDREPLFEFVYRSDHAAIMARRRDWFEHIDSVTNVLWWIAAGSQPTLQEAHERLVHLRDHGPTPQAFTFKQPFAKPTGAQQAFAAS